MQAHDNTQFREAVDQIPVAGYDKYWRVLNAAIATLQQQFVNSPHEKTYCMVCSGLRIDERMRIRELEKSRRALASRLSEVESIYEAAVSDAIEALDRGDLGAALNALHKVHDADAVELCRQEAP